MKWMGTPEENVLRVFWLCSDSASLPRIQLIVAVGGDERIGNFVGAIVGKDASFGIIWGILTLLDSLT